MILIGIIGFFHHIPCKIESYLQRDALSEFLDWLEEKDDVFFVTGTQVGKLLTKTFEAITQYNIWTYSIIAGPSLDD